MTNMEIEIVSTQLIRPSSPTPTQLRDFELSFIDERIPPSYIPLILYYNFNEDKNITRSKMSHRLKSSLSDALVQFYPLAGRMKGQTLVECNDDGVLYIEANADAKILDIIKSLDSGVLDKLIPFKSNGCVSSYEEQLAVQATSFNCGGIAVGICVSHRIGDGCTLSSFIKCWAAMACRDHGNEIAPVFKSATLFPPRNTPDFKPNFRSPSVRPLAAKTVMKRFVFTSSAIDALKLQVTENSSIVKPTRVEVLTGFLWSRCVVAKGLKKSDKSVAYHPVNLRGRIPELTENSFGNIFQMISAKSAGETNWIHLVEKLRAAFWKMDSEYVKKLLDKNGFELAKENFSEIGKFLALGDVDVFRFSSYCRFPFYEADFGWGKPVWVSSASYESKDSIFLFDSIEWPGGIEAWIVMADQDMERLQQDMELQHFTKVSRN
ncbi:hypothetical protein Pfo_020317 [Paulownia fortunei]|nr:hypothetical protein Pfo_020317 [Paulownia fortunei]